MSSHILLDFEILVFLDIWLELVQYIFSDQSSDFFHQLHNYSKKILLDPTKYIYFESARRDPQNDEIYQMSKFKN